MVRLMEKATMRLARRHWRIIDRALEISPDSRPIRANQALLLFHMGHTDEARAIRTSLPPSDPDFASPHGNLAEISLATGDDAVSVREAGRFAQATSRPVTAAIVAAAAAGQKDRRPCRHNKRSSRHAADGIRDTYRGCRVRPRPGG
jgi:predicted Zn-dependent protease